MSATETPDPEATEAELVFKYISFAVMAVIIVVGSLGNVVVLYVFSQKKDRQTANIFILSLAVSDMIACTLLIPMTIRMEACSFRSNLLLCKIYYLFNSSGIPFSCMLMTAIAVDRYFCICRPFLRAITIPRAKGIVLGLGTVALSLGITTSAFCSDVVAPVANSTEWEYSSDGICKEINDIQTVAVKTNSSGLHVAASSVAFFNVFQKIHMSLFGVCIVVVVLLYVSIYQSVLKMRRRRRELRGQRQNNQLQLQEISSQRPEEEENNKKEVSFCTSQASCQKPQHRSSELLRRRRKSLKLVRDSDTLQNLKTAAMLFVVTIVFASTFVPAALMSLGKINFNMLVFYMYYLTHATNPLIYCFMNQNFREDLNRIFCGGVRQRSGAAAAAASVSQTTRRLLPARDTAMSTGC